MENTLYKNNRYCPQGGCINNTGLIKGKIDYGISMKCMLDNPKIIEFENAWGCEDERYPGDIKME